MSATILSVEHVGVRFGGLVAIADLDFHVRRGEILSLIGPNGAGKTTAFNVMTGFLAPSHGVVRLNDVSLAGLRPHQITRLGLARTFQRTSVFPADTVFDNVLIGLHRQGRSSLLGTLFRLPSERRSERDLRAKVADLLAFVGLSPRAGERAGALAYGEQRLLGIALALAADPTMLLLDEPASGMNPAETDTVVHLIRAIRDRGVTVLLVEHDMPMVMEVSDRIVVLNYGRLVAEGAPAVIRQDPAVIEAYLGKGSAQHEMARSAAAHA